MNAFHKHHEHGIAHCRYLDSIQLNGLIQHAELARSDSLVQKNVAAAVHGLVHLLCAT